MNTRKLGLLLLLGGVMILVLAVVWFVAAYAEVMDAVSRLGGGDMTAKMMACLYSSPHICQGAGFFGEGPSYSPVLFWIGVISSIAGVVIWLSSARPTTSVGEPAAAGADGPLLGFIPSRKYTRSVYVLLLIGGAGCLIFLPLAVVGLAGFMLALLGLWMGGARLEALDRNHLAAASLVFAGGSTLLLVALGSFFFLLAGLAQLALYYIGFNSYRRGRAIRLGSLKEEALLALRPLSERLSDPK
jgi:hypothetical protein